MDLASRFSGDFVFFFPIFVTIDVKFCQLDHLGFDKESLMG